MSADAGQTNEEHDSLPSHVGVFRAGKVELDHASGWPDGVQVRVQVADSDKCIRCEGPAVIAGFGPAGRCVADLLNKHGIDYIVIDRNPKTVTTQEELGRRVVLGDVSDPAVLDAAGIRVARLLVMTVPDEKSTVRAIRSARLMNPALVILARTEYVSTGMNARKAGASAVISAELAVAKEFHELLMVNLARTDAVQPGMTNGHTGG